MAHIRLGIIDIITEYKSLAIPHLNIVIPQTIEYNMLIAFTSGCLVEKELLLIDETQ